MRVPAFERGPDRRAQIIHAAGTVIGREGYARTTLRQIALEARVAPGLLHYYFKSKQDLLLAVIEALFQQMTDEWQAAVAGISDPLERVAAGIDHVAKDSAERPEINRLLLDFYALSVSNPALRDRTRQLLSRFQEHMVDEIRRDAASLPTPLPMPERDLVRAVHGALDGICMLSVVAGEDLTGAFQALKVALLSLAAMSYVLAGEPVPMDRLMASIQPSR